MTVTNRSSTADAVATVTIGALRRQLARRLSERWGQDTERTAELDAKLLLAHALGMDAARLTLCEHDAVAAPAAALAGSLIERRLRGEPVARIVGEKEFWGLPFRLSPGTLVPRPDTETLVKTALEAITVRRDRFEPLRLLDLGTGTGCVLLALLSELPNATGLGIDRSPDAVATAADNAARLDLSGRARFAVGDWAKGISDAYDVIAANPPYIEEAALPGLPVEVIGHDPRLALAGGPDGLEAYRAIIPELPRLLRPKGFAVLEFGPRQSAPIAGLASAAGMTAAFGNDLGGRERVAFLTMLGKA
ncbi:MAG: peptide chain release factor N(5)-glutamine methyltransferase [Bauldia sp.]